MKKALVYVMPVLYMAAGINHFWHAAMYVAIMPPWLPYPVLLVYMSGVFEFMLGLLLFPSATRRLAAWGIVALLVAVFPANIQMAINYYHAHNPNLWLAIVRLPLQPVLIWWAWLYTRRKYTAA